MKYIIFATLLAIGCTYNASEPVPVQPINKPIAVPLEGPVGSIVADATTARLILNDTNGMPAGMITIVNGELFWTPFD